MATKEKGVVCFSVNTKVYHFESILAVAYSFLDRVHVFLDGDPKKQIKICLKLKKEASGDDLESVKGEFHNELLGQDLRMQLAKDNKKLREYIVGQALFGASPAQTQSNVVSQDDELDKILERELKALEEEAAAHAGKPANDPLNVLTGWEERSKKRSSKKKRK